MSNTTRNQTAGEIKAHHYILSFDPEDQIDRGLTPEKAQALGMEYAKKNFPGHQTIVCTHSDGSHGSGNIHVHIVFNSLRKLDVEHEDFMERPCDSRAGYKHHQTRALLTHMQKSLMEICLRENLHQVDLLSPARNKITEREYWANQRGQEELDKTNQEVIDFGLTPARTKYQTQKQFLRDAIADIAKSAKSLEEFHAGLLEKYQIQLSEKRGSFRYLHPERKQNITGRTLGTDYEKEFLLALFEKNRLEYEKLQENDSPQAEENMNPENMPAPVPDDRPQPQPDGGMPHPDFFDVPMPEYVQILFIKSDLRLVVDLQNNIKVQQSRAYAQKVKISNLQQMAKTVAYVQENGYDTRENLQSAYEEVVAKRKDARKTLRGTEEQIKSVNQLIHYTGQYLANKKIYQEMLRSPNKKKYRQEHRAEIELYEAARKFLKEQYPDGKFPSMKTLKAEKEKLSIKQKAQQDTYNYFKDYASELKTVTTNVDAILGFAGERK